MSEPNQAPAQDAAAEANPPLRANTANVAVMGGEARGEVVFGPANGGVAGLLQKNALEQKVDSINQKLDRLLGQLSSAVAGVDPESASEAALAQIKSENEKLKTERNELVAREAALKEKLAQSKSANEKKHETMLVLSAMAGLVGIVAVAFLMLLVLCPAVAIFVGRGAVRASAIRSDATDGEYDRHTGLTGGEYDRHTSLLAKKPVTRGALGTARLTYSEAVRRSKE